MPSTNKKDNIITNFNKKIINYHHDKLNLELKSKKSSYIEDSTEYIRLTKAKKDIQDRINETIGSAILFAKITEWADSTKPADYTPKLIKTKDGDERPANSTITHERKIEFKENISELLKAKFPLKFRKNKTVHEKLEEDHQEYVREVFNEHVIRDIISSIFYGNYHTEIDDFHKEYRADIAKLMIGFAATELKKFIHPQYRQFLEGDIDRAVGLCKSVDINPITSKSYY